VLQSVLGLVHNPLFDPFVEEDDCVMSVSQLPRYNGNERGSAGVAYLAAQEAFVGLGKWGTPSESLYKRMWAFAAGAEPASVFAYWCRDHVIPLAQQIQAAAATCSTHAAHQAVLNQYQPQCDAVFDLFKQRFCVPDVQEYGSLLSQLANTCAQHAGGAVWRPLLLVLQKFQEYYQQPLPSGVQSQSEFVTQLLNTPTVVPESLSLRLKAAVDGLPQHQLPAVPANAPANHNPRLTLAAVITAVSQLADQLDHAVGWSGFRFPLAPGVSGLAAAPAMSQQSVVTATTSHVQSRDPSAQAANLAASLQHLSVEDRCQVLAKAYPDALCPEHQMLHAMRVCPFAASDCDRKPSRHVKHVNATLAGSEVHNTDELLQRVTQEVSSIVDTKLSVFAAGYGHGHGHGRYYDQRGGGYSGGGYNQFRPIGPGYRDGPNYRDGFAYRERERERVLPQCDLCGKAGHSVDACFILHPEKCDRQRLELLVPPPHLQAFFDQQKERMFASERPSQPHTADLPPGDVYPPRGPAGQNATLHNHCVVTQGFDKGEYIVEVVDDAELDGVLELGIHAAAIDIRHLPDLTDSSDTDAEEEPLPSLVPVDVVAEPSQPAAEPSVVLSEPVSLESDAEPELPPAVSASAMPELIVCVCGSKCRLRLEVTGDQGILPVWECEAKDTDDCVSRLSANGSSVVSAFVA
jgi:hypothetical protein